VAQPGITDLLNRIRQPFNVNSMAQAAAAAALFDEEFLNRSQRVNQEGLAQLGSAISSMGLSFIPSWGNFLLVKVGDAPDAGLALFKALLAKGVITRPVANYDLPQWLRISVGTSEENEKCIAAMKVVLPSLRSAA
jgi:histidinol-phosphate aminotransferase